MTIFNIELMQSTAVAVAEALPLCYLFTFRFVINAGLCVNAYTFVSNDVFFYCDKEQNAH